MQRTNLVEDQHELLPPSIHGLQLPLDRPAPRPDGVPRIQDLDNDIAHLEDLSQALGMQFERRVLHLRFLVVLVHRLAECEGVFPSCRVGGEGGSESGGRGERAALLVGGDGGISASGLFSLDLRSGDVRSSSALRSEKSPRTKREDAGRTLAFSACCSAITWSL